MDDTLRVACLGQRWCVPWRLSLSLSLGCKAPQSAIKVYMCVYVHGQNSTATIVQYCMYAMEKGKGLDNGPGRTDWAGLHTAWDSTA